MGRPKGLTRSPTNTSIASSLSFEEWSRIVLDSPLRFIPLAPGTNRPFLPDWPRLATSDQAALAAWGTEYPGCNWGILTGDGLGVLDLDTKNDPFGFGGYSTLIDVTDLLEIDVSNLPAVETASGLHLYFRYFGKLPSRIGWLPHLDVIADGGRQVGAPGTVRKVDGLERIYRPTRGSLDSIPFAPSRLIEAIRTWRTASRGSSTGIRSGYDLGSTDQLRREGFRHGERDNGFNALAWRLVRTHYPYMDLVRQQAWEVWEHTDQGSDPYPWAWVEKKIARAEAALVPTIEAELDWAASIRRIK